MFLLGRVADRVRVFRRGVLAALLLLVMGAVAPQIASADGSATLFPTDAACTSGGNCRANIEWRTSSYGPAGSTIGRRTMFHVFANSGEVLVMGSSAVNVGSGDVLVFNPGVITDHTSAVLPTPSFSCATQAGISSQGKITSRAQELAGADTVPPTIGGAYDPCTYAASTTGLYSVVFTGPSGASSDVDIAPTADITLTSADNFNTNQGTSVAAWEISVRGDLTSSLNEPGRVFTYSLAAYTGGNGRPVSTTLYAVTLDGYRYQTDTRGLDPNGFVFYGNQVGFYDSDGTSPLNHDAYSTAVGTGQMTTLAGGVSFGAPIYPIFLTPPDDETLDALSIPTTPTAPSASASYTGDVGPGISTIGVGGSFSYTSNVSGLYEMIISRDGVDFDPTNPLNRTLRGLASSGTHAVAWDGKDNSGTNFPVGAGYKVHFSIHGGEYHFPLLDVENSTLGGPSLTLLNPPGGVCPNGCSNGFFDDRGYFTLNGTEVGTADGVTQLCGANPPAAPYHADWDTGYDTTGSARAFGTASGGNANVPCNGSFGDVKGLDTWTFFPSAEVEVLLEIVEPDLGGPGGGDGPGGAETPEAGSLLLFGSGLAGLASYGRTRWLARRKQG